MRSPYLRWFTSEGQEQIFVLSVDETLLGRKSDADVILRRTPTSPATPPGA